MDNNLAVNLCRHIDGDLMPLDRSGPTMIGIALIS
jgi:hypothetical protein